MERVVLNIERCKSCEYCINACPVKALSLSGKFNRSSYEYVQLDEEKCIKCGTCYVVCPDVVFSSVEE